MNVEIFGSILKFSVANLGRSEMTQITLMGTNVLAVGAVGNRDVGSLEPRVRGGVDPPTWRPGSGAGQGQIREGTPQTDREVRVGCAKDVVHTLNCQNHFCFSSRAHALCGVETVLL